AGDVGAFDALVRRYEARVYRVALRVLGNPSDAQDAVQEAFVQAWQSLGRLRADGAFAGWLYRITTSRCADLLGARRPAEPLESSAVSSDPGPARLAELADEQEALKRAIVRLPFDQRAALVLREFAGLSYEEVAEVLGVSLSAVKGRLYRARGELVQEMRPWR
ncbi:MAG: RNA polymerase sigma factor, partial [Solirubrobacteraceae bacterium]